MVKILVDGLMHVGDILIASSVLPVLKKAYPESQITYLTYGNLCAAAQMLEGVDDVVQRVHHGHDLVIGKADARVFRNAAHVLF